MGATKNRHSRACGNPDRLHDKHLCVNPSRHCNRDSHLNPLSPFTSHPRFTALRNCWRPEVKLPTVYILASRRNGVLYVGVTSDLVQRIHQHRSGLFEGFCRRYSVHRLVHFEHHGTMEAAILREKRIKKWRRAWKIQLIEAGNPEWVDLWAGLRDV
ncbi:MAG: GIY-YIG nuclease family protein [Candidatus Delongbacteria bacterium]|nr:GIY-YIG nuclease family protein [Candidatus Delongbacteria bacterium]